MSTQDIRTTVRERYGKAALKVASGAKAGCCGGSCGSSGENPITSNLYSEAETAVLPVEAVLASLGCGNPTALADLHEGNVVLDLGSGGGIDVLLSARRVAPTGKAYGLDMTDEMLTLARENQRKADVENAEFLKGHIESIPLPMPPLTSSSRTVWSIFRPTNLKVISRSVSGCSPGGRFAVSDVVVRGKMPAQVRTSMELWVDASRCADRGRVPVAARGKRLHGHWNRADADLRSRGREALLRGYGIRVEVLAREVGGCVGVRSSAPGNPRQRRNGAPIGAGPARPCARPRAGITRLSRELLRAAQLPLDGVPRMLTEF
jgi:SAM-dependent methyltransferase